MLEKVNALKYNNDIIRNIPLYRYLSIIVGETNIASKLTEFEYDWFFDLNKRFLKDKSQKSVDDVKKQLEPTYQAYVDKILKDGLHIIQQQLIVSAYSTYDLFIEHLVTVFCEYFPELYSKHKTRLNYETISKCSSIMEIQDFYMKQFIIDFGFFPFEEKVSFIKNKLKLSDDYIWNLNGKNYLSEINGIRNKIVQSEWTETLEYNQFCEYIDYLASVVFKLAVATQADHGIEFIWIKDTNINVIMADKPTL